MFIFRLLVCVVACTSYEVLYSGHRIPRSLLCAPPFFLSFWFFLDMPVIRGIARTFRWSSNITGNCCCRQALMFPTFTFLLAENLTRVVRVLPTPQTSPYRCLFFSFVRLFVCFAVLVRRRRSGTKTGTRGHTRASNKLASRVIQVTLRAVAEPQEGKARRASDVTKH